LGGGGIRFQKRDALRLFRLCALCGGNGIVMNRKILSRKLRRAGRKIVFTNGCYVLLHAGHARYLRKARRLGDLLIVGLNSDRSVRRLKGPGRPLMPERDRAELLASLESVDYVTTFGEDTPRELIAELAPDILVKGGDYRPSEVVGRETVEGSGGKIVIIPLAEGRSTTDLIRRVKRLGR